MTSKVPQNVGTLVLAESEVLLRAPLAEFLRDCGIRVVEATSAEEAKMALAKADLNITTVLTSVELAGDGFGISSWAKKNRPDVVVKIAGTARRAVEIAASICEDGGTPRLNPQLLQRRVQQMLSSRRPPDVA